MGAVPRERFSMSFKEIARVLGMSRPGVELIYARAIAKLQRRIDVEAPTPRTIPGPRLSLSWGISDRGDVGAESRMEYRDWDPERTVVVSGPYGKSRFPGRRFPTRGAARRYWVARAGHIYEEHRVPGRYIFRVRRGTHGN